MRKREIERCGGIARSLVPFQLAGISLVGPVPRPLHLGAGEPGGLGQLDRIEVEGRIAVEPGAEAEHE